MSAFEELGVMPEIIQALEEIDWHLPTPVQTEAIPLILGGGDVAVAAETGAGKTGAFCLPILQIVYETQRTDLSKKLTAAASTASMAVAQGPICLSEYDRGRQVAVDVQKSVAQCRDPVLWQGLRATRGVTRGKWYFMAKVEDDGLCRVGWSSAHAALNLGTDRRGFGYGGTAMKSHDGKFVSYGQPYGKGDTICCMLEFLTDVDVVGSQVSISFMRNGEELGNAFTVSWGDLGIDNLCLFPAVALKNAQIAVEFSSRSSEAEALGFKSVHEATIADSEVSEAVRKMFEDARANEDVDAMKDVDKASDKVLGSGSKAPLALILEPSRELAGQVEEELTRFSKHLESGSVKHLLLTGGGNPKSEKAALSAGRDIVSGTLGSIVKHVRKGTLSLNNVRFFVLDEADTFATDNLADVLFLHQKVPTKNRVQTLLFSATLHSPEIRALSQKIQAFPTWVDLKGKEAIPETVHHTLVRLDADSDTALLEEIPASMHWPLDDVHLDKKKAASRSKKPRAANTESDEPTTADAADVRSQIMKKLKLTALKKTIDANDMSHAMLFVRTQRDGDNLEAFLLQCSGVSFQNIESSRFRGRRESGPEVEYSCAVLHGGRRQQERVAALAAFKAGEVRFLICTDVAARGIDIVGLPFLVNVTLPDKSENYIHRVGRVGRAERLGLAVSLVSSQKEAVWFHTCKKAKGGVCNNRKLVDAGGCVMWYNEPKLLSEIEGRLKGPIEELGDNFKRKNESSAPTLYGSRQGEEQVGTETARHIEMLKPAVRELVRMEEDAQASFFDLQSRYALAL